MSLFDLQTRGKTLICPYGEHLIKESRIKQHIKRHHPNLLKEINYAEIKMAVKRKTDSVSVER